MADRYLEALMSVDDFFGWCRWHGLSYADIASSLGIHYTTVYRVRLGKSGKTAVRKFAARAIAVFGSEVAVFFEPDVSVRSDGNHTPEPSQ